MIEYKIETSFRSNEVYYPKIFFIQNSLLELNEHIIFEFYSFLDTFKSINFVEEKTADDFVHRYNDMRKKNLEIPKEKIFNSSFPESLAHSIQQLLIKIPKGDRILSPYIYALSYIINLNNSYYDESIIEMLLEIISKYSNFSTTLLHSLVCLIYLSQDEKYDDIYVSKIEQLLFLAQNLPNVKNSQAIVKYSQLLLNISKKEIDECYLKGIAQILIQFAIYHICPNDMNGVLSVISEFISLSRDNFQLMIDSKLIQRLPYILDVMYKYKDNNGVMEIVDQLIEYKCYDIFLFDLNIVTQLLNLFRIKIYESDDDLKINCIDIINRLTIIINNSCDTHENIFLPQLKNSLIIEKLCDDVDNDSFKLKISSTHFFINLIFTKDIDIVHKLIDDDILEFIVDTEQMSGFFDQDKLISSLKISIDFCDNEYKKECLLQKLKEVEEYEPI